jgi:hypothetical protein
LIALAAIAKPWKKPAVARKAVPGVGRGESSGNFSRLTVLGRDRASGQMN